MKRPVIWLGIVVAVLVVILIGRSLNRGGSLRLGDGPSGGAWTEEAVWNDGRIEVARYRAHYPVGTNIRAFETTIVTAVEEMDRRYLVRAGEETPDKDRVAVFRMNVAETRPGDGLHTRLMTTLLLEREDMSLRRMTVSGQELMGSRFKDVVATSRHLTVDAYGHRAGEGKATWSFSWKNRDFTLESFPLLLRGLPLSKKYRLKCRVLSELASSRSVEPELRDAEIKVTGEETVPVEGSEIECYKVELRRKDSVRIYWMEKSFPNILVKLEDETGSTWTLIERTRRSFAGEVERASLEGS